MRGEYYLYTGSRSVILTSNISPASRHWAENTRLWAGDFRLADTPPSHRLTLTPTLIIKRIVYLFVLLVIF